VRSGGRRRDPYGIGDGVTDHRAVDVVHFTDFVCPWAYSAEPYLRKLEWRFGNSLSWRTVMIGLSETTERYASYGMTSYTRSRSNAWFRDAYGMPISFDTERPLYASGRGCRLVVAARAQGEERSLAFLRALRLAAFTTPLDLGEDADLRTVAATVDGLDVERLFADVATPQVEARYQADRDETRAAAETGTPAIAQGRTSSSDGPERFTAPSLIFDRGDRVLVAGGMQGYDGYDTLLANLAPDLPRCDAPDPLELLAAYPDGLTTAEIAMVVVEREHQVDRAATERQLLDLLADRKLEFEPLGQDGLWRLAR
jgi:2-hydroxychromene-2-carboxylate isomerase